MEESLSSLFGNNESAITILQKLLESDDVELKTDINNKAIWTLARVKWYSERQKKENINKSGMEILSDIVIPYILKLKISNNRKSRTEIVQAITNLNKDLGNKGSSLIDEFSKK